MKDDVDVTSVVVAEVLLDFELDVALQACGQRLASTPKAEAPRCDDRDRHVGVLVALLRDVGTFVQIDLLTDHGGAIGTEEYRDLCDEVQVDVVSKVVVIIYGGLSKNHYADQLNSNGSACV